MFIRQTKDMLLVNLHGNFLYGIKAKLFVASHARVFLFVAISGVPLAPEAVHDLLVVEEHDLAVPERHRRQLQAPVGQVYLLQAQRRGGQAHLPQALPSAGRRRGGGGGGVAGEEAVRGGHRHSLVAAEDPHGLRGKKTIF